MAKITSKKAAIYSAIAIVSLVAVAFTDFSSEDSTNVGANILAETGEKATEIVKEEEAPDLSIKKVTLKKLKDPGEDFSYYKYSATIVIENNGGDVENANLVLSAGADQKHSFLRNTEGGFTLDGGKNYIARGYEVLFESKYNGGVIDFRITLQDEEELDTENNSYNVAVFEGDAKISDAAGKLPAGTDIYYLEKFFTDKFRFKKSDISYQESLVDDVIVSNEKIANSAEVLESKDWSKEEGGEYFYYKATDPGTGYFIVSDIYRVKDNDTLNRAAFAAYFAEMADVDDLGENVLIYDDVSKDDWFYDGVLDLYNAGVLDTYSNKFEPSKTMSRGQALKIISDYFDVDFEASEDAHFDDVSKSSEVSPYTQTLLAKVGRENFAEKFKAEMPATKEFVNFLINAYQ